MEIIMDTQKLRAICSGILVRLGITEDPDRVQRQASAELIDRISDVHRDMEQSRRNYEFADDDTLIDMYIYSLKAQEMKYKHLLQTIKKAQ